MAIVTAGVCPRRFSNTLTTTFSTVFCSTAFSTTFFTTSAGGDRLRAQRHVRQLLCYRAARAARWGLSTGHHDARGGERVLVAFQKGIKLNRVEPPAARQA
jgi:hypothetical protein